MNSKKAYEAVLSGRCDNNMKFRDLQKLILDLGMIFQNQEGSHMRYRHPKGAAVNIQNRKGNAKPYQVKQVRDMIIEYHLHL